MMHLFLNGLAASAGAGVTYVRNVIPHLSGCSEVRTTLVVSPWLRREFGDLPNVSFLERETPGAARRFWQEQTILPRLIRRSGADVLISAGNFALRKSPVPQILLSGNSLYTSANFFRDLHRRGDYRLWVDTQIKGLFARRSVRWADCTVAPSETFADELRRWTGGNVISIHHGFDHEAFFRDPSPLPSEIARKLVPVEGEVRLLFVSHYNYYRNFETLFRAMLPLREKLGGGKVKLFLTCRLRSEENPGAFRAEAASALIQRLGISEQVVELGTVPYHLLHQVYRACSIYVTAAYAETFAHPLVEAMASGLPVVASDLAVHREICAEAAAYFPPFSPEKLAEQVLRIAHSADAARALGSHGQRRSQAFSWDRHVDRILSLAVGLSGSSHRRNQKAD